MSLLAEQYYRDIVRYCGRSIKAVNWAYDLIIFTPRGEHTVDRVLTIDTIRDYEKGFTDSIVVEVQVMKSFYMNVLYPIRDDFNARLVATQVTEKESGMQLNNPIIEKRDWRAVLVNPIDIGQYTPAAANAMDNGVAGGDKVPIKVQIQLLPYNVEEIYKMTYGGIFSEVPAKILRSMLTELCGKTRREVLKGVDMVPADMDVVKKEVVVPHGTRAIDLARHLQDKQYGIYHDGIGSYIFGDIWYIYPLYKTGRWEKEKYRATISIVPKAMMLDSVRSYHVHNGEINIICTGDVSKLDRTMINAHNQGDGVTVFEAKELETNSVSWVDGKPYIDGTKAKKQIAKYGNDAGLGHLPLAKNHIVQSTHGVKSELASRQGVVVGCTWEHSHPSILKPGMPVKLIYWKGNKKYEAYATLLKETSTTQLTTGIALKRHGTNTVLSLYCDPVATKRDERRNSSTKGVSGSLLDGIRNLFK